MLTIQDGQGECRQRSGIPGDGVGVAGIIFISNQLLDGLLERQNGEVPRQTNVRMGIKTNGIDENNARIGRASGMECHHYEDQAGVEFARHDSQKHNTECRKLYLSKLLEISLDYIRRRQKTRETHGTSTMLADQGVSLAMGFDQRT